MISVFVDHNEAARKGRADALKIAVEADPRFSWGGAAELPLDVQFFIEREEPCGVPEVGSELIRRVWNVELKEGADLIASISSTGHLEEQLRSARETGQPCALLVLANDAGIEEAINASVFNHSPRFEGIKRQLDYLNMWQDFRAQLVGLNIIVMEFSRRWPQNLLSTAAALFGGGNLLGHRPKVLEGERQIVALCALADRLGPVTARNILAHFGTFGKAIAAFSDPFCNANFENIDLLGPVKTERVYKSVNKKLEFRP